MSRWPIQDTAANRSSTSSVTLVPVRIEILSGDKKNHPGRNAPADGRLRDLSQADLLRFAVRRTRYISRGKTFLLRDSELRAMTDIGMFRTVDAADLARFQYEDAPTRMYQDLESLRRQGLLFERTVYRAHSSSRKILALSKAGHRLLRKTGAVANDQRIYHGFVKPRELDHDADLYKLYQKELQEIREQGGTPRRVKLDFELKHAMNTVRAKLSRSPEAPRQDFLEAAAKRHGLRLNAGTIQIPDIQIEYETREGTLAHANLELVSKHYRGDAIRGKAQAGFKVYARAGDSNRVRRALYDTGAVEEILSL